MGNARNRILTIIGVVIALPAFLGSFVLLRDAFSGPEVLENVKPVSMGSVSFVSPVKTPTPEIFPTYTPVPTLTSVKELPEGTKIVYSETDETLSKSIVWIASANSPDLRRQITTIEHLFGYSPHGYLSPDGKHLAIVVVPPAPVRGGEISSGGELWVIGSNGDGLRRLADRVAYFGGWADDQELAFARFTAVADMHQPTHDLRPGFYTVTMDGTEAPLLAAETVGGTVHPVGWSDDGIYYYWAQWARMPEPWELWSLNTETHATQLLFKAASATADSPVLLGGRRSIMYNINTELGQQLIVQKIGDRELKVIAEAPSTNEIKGILMGIPSLEDDDILMRVPSSDNATARLLVSNPGSTSQTTRSGAADTVPVVDGTLVPISWSPDEQWIALSTLPTDPSIVYLFSIADHKSVQIPKAYSQNWISVWGWMQ